VFATLLAAVALTPASALAGYGTAARAHTTTTATPPPSSLIPQPLGSGGLSGGLPATPSPPVAPSTSAAPPILPTATTASTGSGGLGGNGVILLAVITGGVLAVVAYFIWRDARRHAPVKPGGYTAAEALGGGRSGSKAPPKSRKLSQAERKRRKRGRAR
jgi:hypothetical protein